MLAGIRLAGFTGVVCRLRAHFVTFHHVAPRKQHEGGSIGDTEELGIFVIHKVKFREIGFPVFPD